MSANRLEDRELIEKIYAEVKDPELRGQLVELVVNRDKVPEKSASLISQLGISRDAVRNNVKLWIFGTAFLVTGRAVQFMPQHDRVFHIG